MLTKQFYCVYKQFDVSRTATTARRFIVFNFIFLEFVFFILCCSFSSKLNDIRFIYLKFSGLSHTTSLNFGSARCFYTNLCVCVCVSDINIGIEWCKCISIKLMQSHAVEYGMINSCKLMPVTYHTHTVIIIVCRVFVLFNKILSSFLFSFLIVKQTWNMLNVQLNN